MLFMMNMVEYEVQFSLISPSSFTLKIHPLYALRVQGGLFFDSLKWQKAPFLFGIRQEHQKLFGKFFV